MLAEALNDAGLDVQHTLRHDISVPWSGTAVKELIWRPVMLAMTGKSSTTEMDATEPSQVCDVLNRHLGEKFGIYVPWPSEESLYDKQNN